MADEETKILGDVSRIYKWIRDRIIFNILIKKLETFLFSVKV